MVCLGRPLEIGGGDEPKVRGGRQLLFGSLVPIECPFFYANGTGPLAVSETALVGAQFFRLRDTSVARFLYFLSRVRDR